MYTIQYSTPNKYLGNNDDDTLRFEWFKNGQPIIGQDRKTFSYDYQDDHEDTILQCQVWKTTTTTEGDTEVTSTRVTATYIWNVFTVGPAGVRLPSFNFKKCQSLNSYQTTK